MTRRLRQEFEAGVHHVYARGNNRQAIYRSDADRHIYLRLLERTIARHRWSCLAYCLMTNHLHLLIETREPNLSTGMQRMQGRYASDFNRRYRRSGTLYEGRYHSVPVLDDRQLVATLAYIAANPEAAGICAAEDWPWSSHAAMLNGTAPAWLDVEAVHAYLEAAGGDPVLEYRRLTT
jgi:REP element-mobilizing transposase RayT